jgi:hypothetical protein
MTGAPAEYRGLNGQMTSEEICLQARQGGKQTILTFLKPVFAVSAYGTHLRLRFRADLGFSNYPTFISSIRKTSH